MIASRRIPVLASALGVLLIAAAVASAVGAAEPFLYSVSSGDAVLRRISTVTAETLGAGVVVTLEGHAVEGVTGVAVHPATGALYATLTLTGRANSELVTLSAQTGVCQPIGDTGEFLVALSFNGAGILYGVTDLVGSPPESLFTLSLEDGSAQFAAALGAGGEGESIAFNTDNGLLYHASGHSGPCLGNSSGVCFEAIHLGVQPPSHSNIPIGDELEFEAPLGLAYSADQRKFYWKQSDEVPGVLFLVSPIGLIQEIGAVDHAATDLALALPEPGSQQLGLAALAILCWRSNQRNRRWKRRERNERLAQQSGSNAPISSGLKS